MHKQNCKAALWFVCPHCWCFGQLDGVAGLGLDSIVGIWFESKKAKPSSNRVVYGSEDCGIHIWWIQSQLPNLIEKCANKVMNHQMTYNGFKQIVFKTNRSCFISFLTTCILIAGSPSKVIHYPWAASCRY